jgi:hypothetical protein
MKRDSILSLWVLGRVAEVAYDPSAAVIPLALEGSSDDEISYHVLLLGDAGFVEVGKDDVGRPRPIRMKWKGHEYLDGLGGNGLGDIGTVISEGSE